jgi:large conductance mechanosensitive channel
MKEFIHFVREQGVVGLAVGFILGGAVSDLVKSLIDNVINPILGIILRQTQGLTQASFTLVGATVKYGALINTFINFCVVAAVVYFGIKKLGLDKLDKQKAA